MLFSRDDYRLQAVATDTNALTVDQWRKLRSKVRAINDTFRANRYTKGANRIASELRRFDGYRVTPEQVTACCEAYAIPLRVPAKPQHCECCDCTPCYKK